MLLLFQLYDAYISFNHICPTKLRKLPSINIASLSSAAETSTGNTNVSLKHFCKHSVQVIVCSCTFFLSNVIPVLATTHSTPPLEDTRFLFSPTTIVAADIDLPKLKSGKLTVDGEASRIFLKARQCESDGDFQVAQQFYEQVIEAEPDFIYAWSNLGNVLTSEGNLKEAILCYKKALSLNPPKDTKAIILLNKASIEMSDGDNANSLRDIEIAEKLVGPEQTIMTNKAVVYSNLGRWQEACILFEKVWFTLTDYGLEHFSSSCLHPPQVISSADRNALPWWLRYSMSLLESSRGAEAVAYLQRTLNRYPSEPECIAFAAALYQTLGIISLLSVVDLSNVDTVRTGSPQESEAYWGRLSAEEQQQYSSESFVADKLHWGAKAVRGLGTFLDKRNT